MHFWNPELLVMFSWKNENSYIELNFSKVPSLSLADLECLQLCTGDDFLSYKCNCLNMIQSSAISIPIKQQRCYK